MLYYGRGAVGESLTPAQMKQGLFEALDKLGPRKKVLVIPPDFTRFHSQAGILTQCQHSPISVRLRLTRPGEHGTFLSVCSRTASDVSESKDP